jgi:hypothetical protein
MERELMRTNDMKLEAFETFIVKTACRFAAAVLLALLGFLLVTGFAESSFAQESTPRKFASPSEASNALFEAAQKEDEPALEAILGAGKEVTSSSDEEEDKLEREQFSKKYQEMHRLVREADGTTVLYIGAENWPFPIPLVSSNGWYFDSKTGMAEIKFRRVGENEATAIEVCEEFVMAKNEAGTKAASEDSITRFAESLASGTTTNAENKQPSPFHGYYFRLVAQNPASGTRARGKRTTSLRLIAYPAEYQSSGIQTFVVTRKGVVFAKDLGSDSMTAVPGINVRSPGWHSAE